MNNIRDMFERALHEQLSAREQAEFETAMQDPAMAAAFEAYADAKADTGNMDAWLRDAALASSALTSDAYAGAKLRSLPKGGRKRAKLFRIAAVLGAVAAAAAIVAIIFVQPGSAPAPNEASRASLAGDGGEEAPKPPKKDKPEDEPKKEPAPPEFGRLDLNGDGKLDGTELPKFMLEQMDEDKSGAVDADEFRKHHKPPMPPKPEEVFKQRDTNGDGKLDGPEIDERMRKDFDDDASGDVSLDEWRKHFRPKPVKPEDEFGKLDKDRDGFLTREEIPTRMVRDWDTNEDGKVSLDEFRRNFKPPMPPKGDGPMPPRPPEGDGPRPPRPPEGDGPRPPRPPEGDGPRPPRPPEGEAPRPPRD
ncbi:MAG: hypothetical protein IPK87_13570 [Planctomycetes bacterium]|nr:hypothetical protein [Planctomycetota bacterium]